MTITTYALLVFLLNGNGDAARIVHVQLIPELRDCITRAKDINDDKSTPYHAACYPSAAGAV